MADIQPSTDQTLSNISTNVRHFMWNDDYIELLAHKLDLQKVRTLVDIGSGSGLLSGIFAIYMRAGATVHGFDLDEAAVQQAQERVRQNPYSVNFEFEVADAHALPMEDDSADLAICHHVLVHVADPAAILKEMIRVVRPGGKVVVFEPNTIVQALVLNSVEDDYSLAQRLDLVRYQYYYERGKTLLGEGDDSIGDHLPRLFLEAGLTEIEVRLSDKAGALVPPYDSREKQARVSELLSWLDAYEQNRDFIRTCFLKGGGTAEEFDRFSAWEIEQNERVRQQIADETFIHPCGMLTYIVMGRVPGDVSPKSQVAGLKSELSPYQA
ncbi:MAG: class I SAM-dependent methyltransferase [Candidatus Sericytochromatia bacterium]